ncbi:MAG: bacillithiol biosynthesis deacetylase BshB1 [Chitinophagales bacterium]|jgi:bacillithiol biosynthesis deacetylase BshB1|nr:bacillithiol biosynthesis deacetylase BshB1 [Chitinophagales bacterium]
MVDILAFGIHPDDVELSCGGTLIKHQALGYKTAICDLTYGEMGTRGNKDQRIQELNEAARILKLTSRVNLEFKDVWSEVNQDNLIKIIRVLRHFRPKIVLANAEDDRHPDHSKAAEMIKKAVFISGLSKVTTTYQGKNQEAYRPSQLYHYIQAKYIHPDFVVDISQFFEEKMKAILSYKSQFFQEDDTEFLDQPQTFISDESFLDFIKSKDVIWGKTIGVRYAEGFTQSRYIGVNDLFNLI